jgi:hypothetical protein
MLQVKWKFRTTQKPVRGCLHALHSLLSELGSSQDVLQMNKDTNRCTWTMEQYSALKRKWAVRPRKDAEEPWCTWLSESSQSEKATHCVVPTLWHFAKEKRSVVARGCGGEREMNRGFLAQGATSVRHCDGGYLSWYPHLQDARHQEGTYCKLWASGLSSVTRVLDGGCW